MSNEQALRVLQEALQVIEINHGWHKEYDDQDTYPGSDLYNQNIGAIREIKAALALPTSAPVDERESFIHWLSTTYPRSHSADDAAHYWTHSHVSALAWQARATLPTSAPNLSDPAVQKRLAAQWGYVPKAEVIRTTNALIEAGAVPTQSVEGLPEPIGDVRIKPSADLPMGATIVGLAAYTAGQVTDAVLAEREACAELMEQQHAWISNVAASALIRARGAA